MRSPHRQLQIRIFGIDGGIGGLHISGRPGGSFRARVFGHELSPYQAPDGRGALLGHRGVQPQTLGIPGHVETASPSQARLKAVVQQQRVSELRRGGQVSGGGRPAEHPQHPLAGLDCRPHRGRSRCPCRDEWGRMRKKIGGEGHLASPVARGQVDVADGPVLFKLPGRPRRRLSPGPSHRFPPQRNCGPAETSRRSPHLHADHRAKGKLSQKQPQTEYATSHAVILVQPPVSFHCFWLSVRDRGGCRLECGRFQSAPGHKRRCFRCFPPCRADHSRKKRPIVSLIKTNHEWTRMNTKRHERQTDLLQPQAAPKCFCNLVPLV